MSHDYRYSIVVRRDDPSDRAVGVLREWDAPDGGGTYGETYTRDGEWKHSNIREDIERASNIYNRLVASDAVTVGQFIAARRP
jgi:hypothetical protein